jgi:hypothetical protein
MNEATCAAATQPDVATARAGDSVTPPDTSVDRDCGRSSEIQPKRPVQDRIWHQVLCPQTPMLREDASTTSWSGFSGFALCESSAVSCRVPRWCEPWILPECSIRSPDLDALPQDHPLGHGLGNCHQPPRKPAAQPMEDSGTPGSSAWFGVLVQSEWFAPSIGAARRTGNRHSGMAMATVRMPMTVVESAPRHRRAPACIGRPLWS